MQSNITGALATLFKPGDVFELRALRVKRRHNWTTPVELGFFNNFEAAAAAAQEWEGFNAGGVYVTLNPVNPDLLARANNRIITPARGDNPATKDSDILTRQWFPVDIDPVRLAGISATKEEKRAAAEVAGQVKTWLRALNWPDPIVADSGNGYHLLYGLKMKSEDKGYVKKMLQALSLRFDTDKVKVDTTVYNPSRIWKLYGTTARKGDSTLERPHRKARIIRAAPTGGVAPLKGTDIRSLLATLPKPPPGRVAKEQGRNHQALDLWLSRADMELAGPLPWEKGRRWVGNCPWEPQHTDRSFAIVQFANGAISASCLHETCCDNSWKTLTKEHGPLFPKGEKAQKKKKAEGVASSLNKGWTDIGNSERFVRMFGERVRWCGDTGQWFVWTGTRWELDRAAKLKDMAKTVAKSIHSEALALEEDSERETGLKWASSSQHVARVAAMTSLAQPDVAAFLDAFDQDPWLLNVTNGTLDLRTREFRSHSKVDLITKIADVEYDPDAKCPRWRQFCEEIFEKDSEVIDYVQRLIGYATTGLTREQMIAFFIGTGANGKSTFLVTLQNILGDYSRQAAPELLATKRRDSTSHPTGLADLRGARLVVSSEIERGSYLSEGLVKQMTGSDMVKARFMRQDFFEYMPTHTIIAAVNHKPIVRGNDDGVWRRIHLVPFPVSFPPDQRDRNLDKKLAKEATGILNWIVEGAAAYQAQGLNPPAIVTEATQEYRTGMDLLHDFIEETCLVKANATVMGKALYECYRDWCAENEEIPVKRRLFHMMLDERGIGRKRVSAGIRRDGIMVKYGVV